MQPSAEAWAQTNAMTWFDDGLSYVHTGGTRRIPFGPYVPGAPDDVNFSDEPNGVWASILIERDSLSDWCSAAPKADVEAKEKDKGGRPPEYDWDAVKACALGVVRERGMPGRSNRRLPSMTQLVEAIMNEWASKGIELAEPTVRRYVGKWLKDL
jgi:hypothetical protein